MSLTALCVCVCVCYSTAGSSYGVVYPHTVQVGFLLFCLEGRVAGKQNVLGELFEKHHGGVGRPVALFSSVQQC